MVFSSSRILSCGRLTSIPTIFLFGVRILPVLVSVNSSTDDSMSSCSSSRTPSSFRSSKMSRSSSSVTEISGSPLVSLAAWIPIHVRSLARGLKTFIITERSPAVLRANFSGFFLAMLLGSISPAKNTTSVVMMVEIETTESPHSLVTMTVTAVAMVRCTILVQMRRVLIAVSIFSSISRALSALSSPLSALTLIFDCEAEAKAVSEMAKTAAKSNNTNMKISDIRLSASIFD